MDREAPELGPESRDLCDQALATGDLGVSAISFWEIAVLVEKGRLRIGLPLDVWRRELLTMGLEEVAIDGAIGIASVKLEDLHRDPADRLIIASAIHRGARLLTADRRILAWRGHLDRHDARR